MRAGPCCPALALRLFPRAKFAQFASAVGVTGSLANMVVGPAVGSVVDYTGNLYHHTFTISCALCAITLALGLAVHGRFMRLGGPCGYVAPGS